MKHPGGTRLSPRLRPQAAQSPSPFCGDTPQRPGRRRRAVAGQQAAAQRGHRPGPAFPRGNGSTPGLRSVQDGQTAAQGRFPCPGISPKRDMPGHRATLTLPRRSGFGGATGTAQGTLADCPSFAPLSAFRCPASPCVHAGVPPCAGGHSRAAATAAALPPSTSAVPSRVPSRVLAAVPRFASGVCTAVLRPLRERRLRRSSPRGLGQLMCKKANALALGVPRSARGPSYMRKKVIFFENNACANYAV